MHIYYDEDLFFGKHFRTVEVLETFHVIANYWYTFEKSISFSDFLKKKFHIRTFQFSHRV